jgi:RNase P subunit RPR2
MVKLSKTETKKEIKKFFSDIKDKNPKEIKKIKRIAMRHKIPLKEKRKLFCKKCLNPFSGKEKVRIKNNKKIVECEFCEYISRWKINSS